LIFFAISSSTTSSIPLPSSEDFFAAQWSDPPARPYPAERANECGLGA
jgi:hypothetical protein